MAMLVCASLCVSLLRVVVGCVGARVSYPGLCTSAHESRCPVACNCVGKAAPETGAAFRARFASTLRCST